MSKKNKKFNNNNKEELETGNEELELNNNEEEKQNIENNNIDKFNITDFCKLLNLSKYHEDSLTMIYGKEKLKTIDDWKKIILKDKNISEKFFNK